MFDVLPDDANREAAAAIRMVGIGQKISWTDLVVTVETGLGKPLRIVDSDAEVFRDIAVTGLLAETDDLALVIYRSSDPPLYARHSVLHEFGHIITGSRDCHVLERVPSDMVDAVGISGAIVASAARGVDVGHEELVAEAAAFDLAGRLLAAGSGDHGGVFGL